MDLLSGNAGVLFNDLLYASAKHLFWFNLTIWIYIWQLMLCFI
ncbi:hypothetical protein Hanom_Chr08g00728371 [Helianthus anomalus]